MGSILCGLCLRIYTPRSQTVHYSYALDYNYVHTFVMIGRERFQNSWPQKTLPKNFLNPQREIVRLSWARLPFQVAADIAGTGTGSIFSVARREECRIAKCPINVKCRTLNAVSWYLSPINVFKGAQLLEEHTVQYSIDHQVLSCFRCIFSLALFVSLFFLLMLDQNTVKALYFFVCFP